MPAIYALHSPTFTKIVYDDSYPDRPWCGLVLLKGHAHQAPVLERRARTEDEAWRLAEHERKRLKSIGG